MKNKPEKVSRINEEQILGPLKLLTKYHNKSRRDLFDTHGKKKLDILSTIDQLEHKIYNELARLRQYVKNVKIVLLSNPKTETEVDLDKIKEFMACQFYDEIIEKYNKKEKSEKKTKKKSKK